MSIDERVTDTSAAFALRIWPVIDVYARLRRLAEGEQGRLVSRVNFPTPAAIAIA